MTSVPERPPIDRTKPPYKDDPVIAALTDEQVWALAEVIARCATSYAAKLEAAGITADDLMGGMTQEQIRAALHPAPAKASSLEVIAYDRIVERDGHVCHICLQTVEPAVLTIDHIVPRSKGGSDQYENLAVAHRRCNSRKGGRLVPSLRYPDGATGSEAES